MKLILRPGMTLFLLTLLTTAFTAEAQLNVNFTVDKSAGCSPLTASFTNKTTGASANATYTWYLGNGNTSSLPNPAAVYTDEKSYTVTLTVQDGGQTASKTATITVYQKPTFDLSAAQVKGCFPLSVNFFTSAQPGSGYINSYYWDFGDGSTQQTSTNSVSHTYTQAQKASVILTATNSYGCYSTVSKKELVTILPHLTAGFYADKNIVCHETDAVQLIDTSSGPGTLSYVWAFSDGLTSTQKNPQHAFNQKGIYNVDLTVTSSEGCTATIKKASYLNVATFKTDFDVPALICNGSTYAGFINTSSPLPTSHAWYLNNQQYYGSGRDFYYSFYTPGTYKLKLANTFGTCIDSAVKQFTVKQTPTSQGFLADIKNGCGAPTDVAFKDTTANAVKWEWRFDAGNGSNAGAYSQAPVYTYSTKYLYTAGLTVTNADGCSKYIYKTVDVRGPQVNIGFFNPVDQWQSTPLCTGSRIGFRVYTTEEIVSWKWDFADGTSSVEKEPIHIFTTARDYLVTLTYATKQGCTGVSTLQYFTINSQPKINDIFASANTVCGNAPITFSANTNITQPSSWLYYTWNFGDGNYTGLQYNAGTKHQYFRDSTYTVTLIVNNNGCYDTLTKTNFITVLPPVPKISSWTNSCQGSRDTVFFNQNSLKAESWTWDFGDGATTRLTTDQPTVWHTYANTGAYKVVLTTTNGQCSVRDSTMAYVLLKQHPQLTANATEMCMNGPLILKVSNLAPNPYRNDQYNYWVNNVTYEDGTSLGGYYWPDLNFQSTINLSYANLKPGNHQIKVITTFGTNSYNQQWCTDTTNVVPVFIKGPTAGYQILQNNVCFNDAAVFKDTSTSIGGTLQTWEWNFGDGQKSTQSGTVSHTYSTPGYYYVTLKVTDNSNCGAISSAYSIPVQVTGPRAAFTASATNVALATTVTFTNNTNTYNSSNTTYKWQINGTDMSTNYNAAYTFNQPGTYTITLIATNPVSGCTSTASQVITVKNFNAAFSFNAVVITANSCPPVLVRFTNNSQNYSNLQWDFGDGTTIKNVSNPTHIYEKAGKYIITLYVTAANGISGTFIDSVTITQPEAVIQSNALDACKGSSITLNAVASYTGSYIWDFGDGSVISGSDTFAVHQYNTPGVYYPTLIMQQSAKGCTGAAPLADKINIRPDPVVTISPADPFLCKGSSLPLQAQASGGTTYEWIPATGLSNANIANPIATLDQTGAYTVKVTDDIGCKNTSAITITVIQPVTVSLTGNTSICAGETVYLKASGAEVYKWINDITGLSSTSIPNPVATPGVTTTYTIAGSDAHSCFTDTAGITIQVQPSPMVNAGPDIQLWPGESAPLQATGSSDITYWNWTPASYLSCSNCADPVCAPLATTTYGVNVKNQYGCAASDTVVVKMLCNENRVRVPNGFTPNGDGLNDEFIIKGISLIKHLTIFNRWGQKVYDRSNFVAGDRSLCWNGTFNGYPAEAGTYVYFIELECPDGSFTRKGTLNLVR
jgi:gliding motility-associated-like protein